jgi:Fe-S cluster biogenesis protein NfuA
MGFEDSVLNLKFIGHCAGCPFAQNTFNNVVSKELKRLVPDIKEIRLEK